MRKLNSMIKLSMPKMSWEKPIEQEMLNFTRSMAIQFERSTEHHRETGWFANNRLSEDCATMAKAYRTVEKHILSEIEIRSSLKGGEIIAITK